MNDPIPAQSPSVDGDALRDAFRSRLRDAIGKGPAHLHLVTADRVLVLLADGVLTPAERRLRDNGQFDAAQRMRVALHRCVDAHLREDLSQMGHVARVSTTVDITHDHVTTVIQLLDG